MLEILIRIHGNKFLKNKIKLLKKSHSDWKNPDLHSIRYFQYCRAFVGVGVII